MARPNEFRNNDFHCDARVYARLKTDKSTKIAACDFAFGAARELSLLFPPYVSSALASGNCFCTVWRSAERMTQTCASARHVAGEAKRYMLPCCQRPLSERRCIITSQGAKSYAEHDLVEASAGSVKVSSVKCGRSAPHQNKALLFFYISLFPRFCFFVCYAHASFVASLRTLATLIPTELKVAARIYPHLRKRALTEI